VVRAAAGAGAAVEEECGLALRVAAQLPIEAVAVADVEMAGTVGLDRRVEGAALRHDILRSSQ
jgi:hypothetical protein